MRSSKYVTALEICGSKYMTEWKGEAQKLHEKCAVWSTMILNLLMQLRTSNHAFLMQHIFGFKIMEISFWHQF